MLVGALLMLAVLVSGALFFINYPPVTAIVQRTDTRSEGSVANITVEATDFRFNPTEVRVKQGQRVRITMNNHNGTHDLAIEGYNVGTAIANGGHQSSVEFVASKTGTFTYYCTVPGHTEVGMTGKLIVESL